MSNSKLDQLYALLEELALQAENDENNLTEYGRVQLIKAVEEINGYVNVLMEAE